MNHKRIACLWAVVCGLFIIANSAFAQGTAFTYQGRLTSGGSPASGSFDLQFALYATNQTGAVVAGPVTNSAVAVSNGLFIATIDFGPGVFAGSNYWLDVAVRTNDGGAFAELTPRQPVTPAPYSIFATSSSNVLGVVTAGQLTGTLSAAQLPPSVVTNNETGLTLGGTFSGNGTNVTNVNATTLNGLAPGNFWQLSGNGVSGGQILGSTNNQALQIVVGGQGALLITTNPADSANLMGGSPANAIYAGVEGSVIAGGGTTNFAGSSSPNTVSASFSSIGGGSGNSVYPTSDHSFIGAGLNNAIQYGATNSFIGGGQNNVVYSSYYPSYSDIGAFIGGGQSNSITGNVTDSLIGGGSGNSVEGGSYGGWVYGASYSAIVGGKQNTIQPVDYYAFIGGGQSNTIAGNVAIGNGSYFGQPFPFASSWSVIGGGNQNVIQYNCSYSTIGGGQNNTIESSSWTYAGSGFPLDAGSGSCVISGGSQNTILPGTGYAAIAGGYQNVAFGTAATVAGYQNQATNSGATVAGGGQNTAAGFNSTISGGGYNTVTNQGGAIGGGYYNTNTGQYATIPGGSNNIASGMFSFAAGQQAQATNKGAFVWADSQNAPFTSTTNDQFLIRAQNGVGINMNTNPGSSQTASLYVQGANSNGWPNSVVWFQNTASASSNAPALRVVNTSANATNLDGALSVSIQGQGIIAEFGNSLNFPVIITNNGTIYATAFVGNGSSLNNLNASQISSGTIPLTAEDSAVVTNNATSLTLSGTFSGSGSGLTNVWKTGGNSGTSPGANYLGTSDNQALELHVNGGRALRLEPTTSWPNVIGGYSGNVADNGAQCVAIGGGGTAGFVNHVSATLGVIAGGSGNTIGTNANDAAITGGRQNTIDTNSWGAFIGGGHGNWIQPSSGSAGGSLGQPSYSVIAGGYGNVVGTNANNAVIAGGGANTNSGNYATIPGGYLNVAGGTYSFAAGQQAQAGNQGSFVWADSQNAPFASSANNQFNVRAGGGVRFVTGGAGMTLDGQSVLTNTAASVTLNNLSVSSTSPNSQSLYVTGNRTNAWPNPVAWVENVNTTTNASPALRVVVNPANIGGVRTPDGALTVSAGISSSAVGSIIAEFGNSNAFVVVITNDGTIYSKGVALTSDRNAKANFTTLDTKMVLAKVAALPVTEWNYKEDSTDKRHIGPVAQDFQAAFGLNGGDDRHISVVDEGGVALAAIQGLNQKLEHEVEAKDAEIDSLKQRLADLEAAVGKLTAKHSGADVPR